MNRNNWIKTNVAKQGGCPKCKGGSGEICADCLQLELIAEKNPFKTYVNKEAYREKKRAKIRAGWKQRDWVIGGVIALVIAWILF